MASLFKARPVGAPSARVADSVSVSLTELAAVPATRDALQFFQRERAWLNDLHLQLCRIPAPTFLEAKRAEWMAAQFRGLGWEAKIDRGGNVVAQLGSASLSSREAPAVAVTAHLDTVLAPRHPEDIQWDSRDGRLRGPGVSDNGAGLTALLALARAYTSYEIPGPYPVLVANVGEEGEGNLNGMRFLCTRSPLAGRIASFIVLDGPSLDHITNHALASQRFEIAFTGPGGHAWSDFGTASPVHALSRAISLFTENAPLNGQSPGSRCSFNFGTIDGGASITSIPTDARGKVDLRSEDAGRIEGMASVLTACVERAVQLENERAANGRVAAKIRELGARPGGLLAEDAPLLEALRTVDAHLGIRSRLDCASTDANLPLSLGLPAVSIGAGGRGGGAHTPQEWFHPEGREKGLQRILLLVRLLVQQPAVAARELP